MNKYKENFTLVQDYLEHNVLVNENNIWVEKNNVLVEKVVKNLTLSTPTSKVI